MLTQEILDHIIKAAKKEDPACESTKIAGDIFKDEESVKVAMIEMAQLAKKGLGYCADREKAERIIANFLYEQNLDPEEATAEAGNLYSQLVEANIIRE